MAIVDSELQFFRSLVVSDASSNGSVMSSNLITSNVQQNVFPHVFKAERDAGDIKYRKLFAKVSNDDDLTLYNAQAWLDNPTPGDDWIVMWEGTQTDTQGDIAGTEAKYGCALIAANVTGGSDSTVEVTVEDASLATGNDAIFRNGGLCGITNKLTPDAVSGTTEFFTISEAPSVTGTSVTLTRTGTFSGSFTVLEGARVFSVLELGDIECVVGTPVVTSTAGTFDHSTYPITGDNIGSVNDTITLSFTDATHFNASGARLGSLGSGIITTNFAPNNPAFTKPYFTVEYLAFGGSFVAGDTIVFTIAPAAKGLWQKRVVPVGCASLSGNNCTLVLTGESS
jgi:hypothetical protein